MWSPQGQIKSPAAASTAAACTGENVVHAKEMNLLHSKTVNSAQMKSRSHAACVAVERQPGGAAQQNMHQVQVAQRDEDSDEPGDAVAAGVFDAGAAAGCCAGAGAGPVAVLGAASRKRELMTLRSSCGELASKYLEAAALWRTVLTSAGVARGRYCTQQQTADKKAIQPEHAACCAWCVRCGGRIVYSCGSGSCTPTTQTRCPAVLTYAVTS